MKEDRDVEVDATLTSTSISQGLEPLPAARELILQTVPSEFYELRQEHARGGLGRVIAARDRRLGRTVAVKELLELTATSERRFLREARLSARLEHPSIVPVHEVGRWQDGSPFYAMKMVSGQSLKESIAKTGSSFTERLALLPRLLAVAEAVAYAHSQGVIHRDLKPSNVLVGEFGETVVVDWGLAKVINEVDEPTSEDPGNRGDEEDITAMGVVLGTPAYMAPEQARGEAVDERADVYSLGVMLYHLLAGEPPFGGSNAEILKRLKEATPVALPDKVPQVPRDLATIVSRCMEPDPARRYANAGELSADLRRFQTGQLVEFHDYSMMEIVKKWFRRNRSIALLSVAFMALGLAATAVFLQRQHTLRQEAELARDRAKSETMRADRQTYALIAQQGRAELDAGHPLRAAPYFSSLLEHEPNSAVNRSGASESLFAIDAISWTARLHGAAISALAFSPDGARLVTASADKSMKVIDVENGTTLSRFDADAPLTCASFGSGGASVVVGTAKGTVLLLDACSGHEIKRFRGIEGPIVACTLTPDATTLLTESRAGVVSLWSVDTGAAVTMTEGEGWGLRARLSPDGKRALVAQGPLEFELFDLRTQTKKMSIRLAGEFGSAEFCGSERIVTVSGGSLQLWDTASGKLVRTFMDDHALLNPKCSEDGARVLAVTADRRVRTWQVASGDEATFWGPHQDAAWAQFADLGNFVISMSNDGVLREYYAPSGDLLFSVDLGGPVVLRPVISRDERHVAVGTVDGSLYLVTSPLGTSIEHRTVAKRGLYRVACTGDCSTVIVGDAGGTVTTFSVDHGLVNEFRAGSDYIWRLRVSSDGSRLLTVSGNVTRIWDSHSHALLMEFVNPGSSTYDAVLSPDMRTVATAGIDLTVQLWDARTGQMLGHALKGAGMSVAFSPNGAVLATGSSRITIWDVKTQRQLAELEGHPTTRVDSLAFDGTGRRLVSAGWDDHLAKVWDLETYRLTTELAGHTERLMAAEFSPDGKTIVTGSFDRTARLWDAVSGDCLRIVPGPVHAVTWTPDGHRLIAGVGDSLIVWTVALDVRSASEAIRTIAARVPWRLEEGRLLPRVPPS